jgi:hypothetical protein
MNNNWKHNFGFKESSADFSYNGVGMATLTCFVSAITGEIRPGKGAGMLSVLLFPTFAGILLSRIARTSTQRTNLNIFNSTTPPHGKDL